MITGIFQNLPLVTVTNDNVPYLGEILMPYVMTTSGVSKMQFSLIATLTSEVQLLVGEGEGEFFSDSAGTISLGRKIIYSSGSSGGTKTLFYKSTKSGTFIFRGGSQITGLGIGGDWSDTNEFLSNTGNARITNFDISQLAVCTNLVRYNSAATHAKGDIGVFTNLTSLTLLVINEAPSSNALTGSSSALQALPLTVLRIDRMNTFDVRHLPNTITAVWIGAVAVTNLLNTGTSSIPAIPRQVTFFNVKGSTRLSSASTDLLLQALASSLLTKTGGATTLAMFGTRTSASDSAVATLASKNYTVSLT